MESALKKLESNHESFWESRQVVRLNGLLCGDFRSAVEEICWQLSLKGPFQEETENGGAENDFSCLEDFNTATSFEGIISRVI